MYIGTAGRDMKQMKPDFDARQAARDDGPGIAGNRGRSTGNGGNRLILRRRIEADHRVDTSLDLTDDAPIGRVAAHLIFAAAAAPMRIRFGRTLSTTETTVCETRVRRCMFLMPRRAYRRVRTSRIPVSKLR